MLYSLNSLKKYLTWDELVADENSPTFRSFLEKMTQSGFEVEGNQFFHLDESIVVVKIEQCIPHPNADKLKVCDVFDGTERFQIVCGAPNAREGCLALLAKVGSVLPNGQKIKKTKLRQIESQGMLCSASELGLSEDSEGIVTYELDEFHLPQSANQALHFPDVVIDFDITPNRGDVLSYYGMAREIAILFDKPFKKDIKDIFQSNFKLSDLPQSRLVKSEDKACPIFGLLEVKGINNQASSPAFIRHQLFLNQVSTISPIVDLTNWVMLEIGQPSHAFNANSVKQGITVRGAKLSEKLTLINHKTIDLEEDSLVVSDRDSALALAGVMGGLDSEVSEQSQEVLFEAAHFSPSAVAGRARKLGIQSEAAFRFERFVDPHLPKQCLEFLAYLCSRYLKAEVCGFSYFDDGSFQKLNPAIELNPTLTCKKLGVDLSINEQFDLLNRLVKVNDDCQMSLKEGKIYFYPPFSRSDLKLAEDLVEEIVRIIGMDTIGESIPTTTPEPIPQPTNTLLGLEKFLTSQGLNQLINYSFLSPDLLEKFYQPQQLENLKKDWIRLLNPISYDKSVMRPTLLPAMMESVKLNQSHQNTSSSSLCFFEHGACFYRESQGFVEKDKLALVLSGQTNPLHWRGTNRVFDFFDLKALVEKLLAQHAINLDDCQFVSFDDLSPSQKQALQGYQGYQGFKFFHPHQTAFIYYHHLEQTQFLGVMGKAHSHILQDLNMFDAKGGLYACELDLKALLNQQTPLQYRNFAKTPIVRRDVSLVLSQDISAQQLLQSIHQAQLTALIQTDVVDVYASDDLGFGMQSLSLRLWFQDGEKTLRESDIEHLINQVLEVVQLKHSAHLR